MVYYIKGKGLLMMGFIDSEYIGDLDDGKITSSELFMLGSNAISWSSRSSLL